MCTCDINLTAASWSSLSLESLVDDSTLRPEVVLVECNCGQCTVGKRRAARLDVVEYRPKCRAPNIQGDVDELVEVVGHVDTVRLQRVHDFFVVLLGDKVQVNVVVVAGQGEGFVVSVELNEHFLFGELNAWVVAHEPANTPLLFASVHTD